MRYLNPQAAALLGVKPEEALGRFCGDVLRPVGPDGVRPCEERCPIVHARFRGIARATEHLTLANGGRRTVALTSSQPAGDRQFQVMRDETEVEATRRLRDTVLAQRGQHLEVDLPYPLPRVLGDAPRLTQVFVNLLANANKFSPPGSTIAIRGAVEPSGIALWVEDEGPGLPEGSPSARELRCG